MKNSFSIETTGKMVGVQNVIIESRHLGDHFLKCFILKWYLDMCPGTVEVQTKAQVL